MPGTIVEKDRKEDSQGEEVDGEEKDKEVGWRNVAYFIDHNGEIVGKYVKKNLWYVRGFQFLVLFSS